MKVTHHISFDLQKHGKRQIIYVKQGDELSREIAFSIYNDGTVWTVPADVTIVQFAYCKSDHIGGCYDKMPDDTDAGSFNDSRTVITMQIHPQVLNVAGNVICELRLLNSDGQILNSFNFYVSVEGSPIAMTSDSEGYYNNIISRRAVLYTEQTLTDEQKAQARENIGAVSAEDLEAKQTFLPVTKRTGNDGDNYTATDEDSGTVLPVVSVANRVDHISAEGKGRQIVFIPYETNMTNSPTLQINGGQVIPIRMRAPKNQGSDESSPDATIPVPGGALMRGVPYTMTFCGKYWLIDSMIDLHTSAVTYTPQDLTNDQKSQALENIGAISNSGGLITGPITMDRDCGIVLSHSSATDQVSLSNESGKLKIKKSVLHESPAIVRGIATPEEDTDAANKAYVDDAINAAIGDAAGALAAMDDVIGGAGE